MIKRLYTQNFILLFERSYRQFLQGIRISLAVSFVILIYFFYEKDSAFIAISICVLGLMPACVGTPRWNFEVNMLLSYLISTAGIFLAYPFSQSFYGVCLYAFLLAFLIYVFSYYKLNTIYSVFTYIVPAYAVLFQSEFSYTLSFAAMNTVAFLICFLICTLLIRPHLRRECLYEMRANLRELMFFIDAGQNSILLKSDESRKTFEKHRAELFLRIQNLRLITGEIHLFLKTETDGDEKKYKDYFTYYLLALQKENFAEITVGLLVKLSDISLSSQSSASLSVEQKYINEIFNQLMQVNGALLRFLSRTKKFSIKDVQAYYEKIYLQVAEKFEIFLQEYLTEQYNVEQKTLAEIHSIFLQFKDNMALLNSRLKFLTKETPGGDE